MCEKAVEKDPWSLAHAPDHFKTQMMCNKVVEENPWSLEFVPDHYKTQGMCEKAVEVGPRLLEDIPDHFKTQEMCDKVVRDGLSSLQYVPNWFVTREGVDMWYDDDDEDNFFKWYDGYKKRKVFCDSVKVSLTLPVFQYSSRLAYPCIIDVVHQYK